ncbi:hypothetical protein KQI63_08635 [bacterium]|nr:hypothetical protein [bacterium]
MRSIRIPMLLVVLGYAALGFGLVGCEPDEGKKKEVHLDPDAVDISYLFQYPVEGGVISLLQPTVRLGYTSTPVDLVVEESGVGCFGVNETSSPTYYYYDHPDYTPLLEAVVMVNGTQLVYREALSYLPAEDFREGYATFVAPDGVQFGAAPGDTLSWSVEVEDYPITSDRPAGWEIIPEVAEPELPENGTIIHPSEAISLDQDAAEWSYHYYYLFKTSDFRDHISDAHVDADRPAVSNQNIFVPSIVHSDTLWLVCHQYFLWDEPSFQGEPGIITGGVYQWVRTLVVEQE